MSEHHTEEIAGRMNIGICCGRASAEGVQAAIGEVAVTVYTVHCDAKLDVIGILFSLGSLRLRGGTYRCGPGRCRCKKMPSISRQPEAF